MTIAKPFTGIKGTVFDACISVTNFISRNSGPQILKDAKKRTLIVNQSEYKPIGLSGGSPVDVEVDGPLWSCTIPIKVYVRVAIDGEYYWGEATTEVLLGKVKYQCKLCAVVPPARGYDCNSCGGRNTIEEVK